MTRKPKEPRRKRVPAFPKPAPLLQLMPGGRVRLDPSCLRELLAWVYAHSLQYKSRATKTLRGLKGEARRMVLGQRKAAEAALRTIDVLIEAMFGTVDVRSVDEALAVWDEISNETKTSPPNVLLFTPPIPGTVG